MLLSMTPIKSHQIFGKKKKKGIFKFGAGSKINVELGGKQSSNFGLATN